MQLIQTVTLVQSSVFKHVGLGYICCPLFPLQFRREKGRIEIEDCIRPNRQQGLRWLSHQQHRLFRAIYQWLRETLMLNLKTMISTIC